ncbi:Internalin-J precursor [Listeria ivanovii subsp. londoniensis]|uniref:LPXTG-motif cell wall anchor domain-containing protein n=1 Tax=Listeria ivanovii TaxID=1638 RepID=A0AAX2DPR8_LISIV|nr:SpaA isopeptide-forming pilin-related protein [Listeria ivanovii]SDW76946.1 LPXTG-motif cell wall anchor domain-containing protein [Listeria ivanovii]VEH47460.1 Internalin-J precursor [Listeria ivanovii subsp. londoniensis]
MRNIKQWKKMLIAAVIGLLVFQNVSPVLATITEETSKQTTLKIMKEDKDTKEKINGSVFELKNKETGESKELSIHENGEFTDESLSAGEYVVKEKTAAPGYILDENEYNVTLTDKEEVVTSISAKEKETTNKIEETVVSEKKSVSEKNLKAAISENIFKKVTLKDGNGKELNKTDRVKNGSGVVLDMNFSFTGKNYKAGDTFTTILPDAFDFGTNNISGNFLPSTEAEWSLNVKTNALTITFLKDGVQEGDYDISISTAFKMFTTTDKTEQNVVFKTAGEDTVYPIEIIPNASDPTAIYMSARPGVVNPEKITVDAKFNLTKETNAKGELKLIDFTAGGTTTIDRATIKVYSSDVSAGGTFIGTKKELIEGTDYTLTYENNRMSVLLDGGLAASGYQVTYERTVNKPSIGITHVTTEAQTIGEEGKLSGNSAIVYLQMINYKHLEKRAVYNTSTQCIDWAIDFNFDKKEISPTTVLKDVLEDSGVEYVANSLKINHIIFNSTTGTPIIGSDASSDWTTSAISANGDFDLTYKNTSTNSYQITYSTKVTDFSSREIKNKITDEQGVSSEASINFQPDLLKKKAGTIDYFNNTMKWTITANSDRIQMNRLSITDTFSSGVTSLESYDVYAYKDETNRAFLKEGRDYTIDKDITPRGFSIQLIGDYSATNKKIVVEINTKIDLSDVTNTIDNKADAIYYDETGISRHIDEIKSEVTPDTNIMNNGEKYGSYNASTGNIDWIVSVNTMEKDYDNLIFDDEMPEGLTLVEDSLQYRNVDSTTEMLSLYVPLRTVGTLAVPGDNNYPTTIDTTSKKIHLEFANMGTSRVFIKYSTKLDENWYFFQSVNNVAKVSDNGFGQKSYSYQTYANLRYRAISKAAAISPAFNNQVLWTLELTNIAPNRPVTNPIITDTLTTGATGAQIVKSSFKVVNSTTGDTIDSKYYDITFENNNFTIQFKDYTATEPIKVTYSTVSLMSGIVANEANVDATDYGVLPESYKKSTASIAPSFTMGSGSGIATIGSLEITKVDQADHTKKLAGAKFQLYTLDGEEAGQIGTTNAEGKILFDGIQSGKYKLVETEAPDGYTISDEYKEGKEVTVRADGQVASYTVENTQVSGSVVLTKEDDKSKAALSGAEFELQTADGTKVKQDLVTDADGKLTVTDLAPGDYQFVETKAPTGYQLDATPVSFVIAFNQATPIEVTKENTAKTGSVILIKEDDTTKAKLAGAEFELQTADGTKVKQVLVTDADGKLTVSNLAPDDYQFVETKAPTGYKLDATPVAFTIIFNQATPIEVTKENTAKTGSVILIKEDSETKAKLSEAEFELQTADGVQMKESLISDKDGKIEVADLAPGNYQFIETKAPTGYKLDISPVTFTIGFNQATPIQVTKENTAKTGSVILTKEDAKSKMKLSGAAFELQTADGTKVKTDVVTDADGNLTVTDLAPGNYQFVETEAPTGYKLDATPVPFAIVFNQATPIQITKENTAKAGSAILTKEDDRNQAKLSGAEFELQTANGTKVKDGLVTNSDGKLTVADLAPGEYQFVETQAPIGYQLNATPVSFSITFNQAIPTQVIKKNTAKTGNVTLTKEDGESKAALSGAEFELQTADGTKVKQDLVTDADGKLTVSNLAPDDYQFVETKAPTGYKLDATPVPFTIVFNQTTTIEVTKENTVKTGSAILTKEDDQTKANLSGAEFELQQADGTKVKSGLVTDADGKLSVADLAPGKYQIIEVKAPNGYQLDKTPIEFTIEFNQQEPIQLTKTNTMSTGSVTLTKIDSETKAPLTGAIFKLVAANKTVLENLTTDKNGAIELTDLAPGDYQLIETKAPNDYELDTTPVNVNIAFNQQQSLQVTKENTKKMVSGTVTAVFVDTAGNELAAEEIHTGVVGKPYKIDTKEIKNYQLVKDPTNKTGVFKGAPQKVTFVYAKNKGPIVVNPNRPTKPRDPVNPAKNNKTTIKAEKSVNLPSTGDTLPDEVIFTGFIISALALFLLRKTRKTQE